MGIRLWPLLITPLLSKFSFSIAFLVVFVELAKFVRRGDSMR